MFLMNWLFLLPAFKGLKKILICSVHTLHTLQYCFLKTRILKNSENIFRLELLYFRNLVVCCTAEEF